METRDRKDPLSARHQERVAQILTGGGHLLRLIDDILDLSRIEAGSVSTSTEPVSVPEVVEQVRATLESMAVRHGVRVDLDAVPANLPMVAADRTRFLQILMNFGSNAIKYNLYVEDSPANVTFMRDLIGSFENVDLLTALNAEAGVELARGRRPHVIVMDINLPGASGIDALRTLRGDPRTKEIPVIALTAAATQRDKHVGMRAGFDHYLTKPVKVDEFLSALEGLLVATRSAS